MTLRLIGQSEDAIHAHAHSSARLRTEEDFTKITLKPPNARQNTRKNARFFSESGNDPLFYFFLKSRDRYLRELGLRKFVIVEVVYMIHTELSRLGL